MGGEWTTTRLGQVVEINPDAIGRDWPYPHIRYIDISSVGEGQINAPPQWMKVSDAPNRAKRLIQKGDTVLSTVRPNRRSMFFASQPGDDWVVSTGFAVLRPKVEFVVPRFLYACVFNHSFTEYLITREKGAAYPAVSPEDIAKAEIPLPPLKEQQAIACILGALDDKIELNRRMNETLEAMARALFKSWFVDFDPVHAKACGQEPSGLAPHIAALFPDSFEPSELGQIPKGWRVSAIGDVVEVRGGGTPKTKETKYWDGGIHPFCTPKDMSSLSSPVLIQTERHLTDAGLAKASSGLLPKGTVLLSSRAPIGYLAIAEIPTSINQGIIAIICNDNLPNLYILLWASENIEEIKSNANGSTFMEISKRNFRKIKIPVPPREVINVYTKVVRPIYNRIVRNIHEINVLESLRDTLLPKLISGELRVPDAERIIGRMA